MRDVTYTNYARVCSFGPVVFHELTPREAVHFVTGHMSFCSSGLTSSVGAVRPKGLGICQSLGSMLPRKSLYCGAVCVFTSSQGWKQTATTRLCQEWCHRHFFEAKGH